MQIHLKDEETSVMLVAMVRPEFDDAQPRVRDLDLAVWLGYELDRSIRQAIVRNRKEIEALGPPATSCGKSRGQEFDEFWLTEEQAIAVCQLSQTPRAASVRTMLRRMFVESAVFQKCVGLMLPQQLQLLT